MPGFNCNRFPDFETNESLAALADGFKCGICLQVLDKAVDTRCGHTFCHECLNEWLSRPQTTKECPECRQPMATRKRTTDETNDNNVLIIGGNVLVEKSLRINAMIEKLKIRCEYEWNGCPEVCPLESLSTHLKTCQHKLCQTCGLSLGPIRDDHNCIESLKRDRNEWQKKCNEWIEKAKEFETKAKDLVMKNKELEITLKSPEFGIELRIHLQIIPKRLLFGKCVTNVGSIEFDDRSIECINLRKGNRINVCKILVLFLNIQCLYACVDPSLPMLCIKLNTNRAFRSGIECYSITDLINDCRFDVHSKDPSEHFIIIELNEAMKEIFVSQLRKKCYESNREFEYKTIDTKTAQLMLTRAMNPLKP